MKKRTSGKIRKIEVVTRDIKSGEPIEDGIDEKKLLEEFNSLQKTVDDSSTMIENRTFEIASGGLVLSLTVLSFLATQDKLPANWKWLTVVIWGLFTACILLHYISHYISNHNASKLRDKVGDMVRECEKYDDQALNRMYTRQERSLTVINVITPILLITGVVSLIVFTSICIFC